MYWYIFQQELEFLLYFAYQKIAKPDNDAILHRVANVVEEEITASTNDVCFHDNNNIMIIIGYYILLSLSRFLLLYSLILNRIQMKICHLMNV